MISTSAPTAKTKLSAVYTMTNYLSHSRFMQNERVQQHPQSDFSSLLRIHFVDLHSYHCRLASDQKVTFLPQLKQLSTLGVAAMSSSNVVA